MKIKSFELKQTSDEISSIVFPPNNFSSLSFLNRERRIVTKRETSRFHPGL